MASTEKKLTAEEYFKDKSREAYSFSDDREFVINYDDFMAYASQFTPANKVDELIKIFNNWKTERELPNDETTQYNVGYIKAINDVVNSLKITNKGLSISKEGKEEAEELFCTGCNRSSLNPLGLNKNGEKFLACCPDSNYQPKENQITEVSDEMKELIACIDMIYDDLDCVEEIVGVTTRQEIKRLRTKYIDIDTTITPKTEK